MIMWTGRFQQIPASGYPRVVGHTAFEYGSLSRLLDWATIPILLCSCLGLEMASRTMSPGEGAVHP